MSEPIVVISNQRIKQDMLDGYKQNDHKLSELVEANKPNTLARLAYINSDSTEASVVLIFSDEKSLEAHLEGMGEAMQEGADFAEMVSFDIYGQPSDTVIATLKNALGPEVKFNIMPQSSSAYMRLKEERTLN